MNEPSPRRQSFRRSLPQGERPGGQCRGGHEEHAQLGNASESRNNHGLHETSRLYSGTRPAIPDRCAALRGPNVPGPLPEPCFGPVLSIASVYFQNKTGRGKREFGRGKLGGKFENNSSEVRGVIGPGSSRRYRQFIVTFDGRPSRGEMPTEPLRNFSKTF